MVEDEFHGLDSDTGASTRWRASTDHERAGEVSEHEADADLNFPGIIETMEESPVLLSTLLDTGNGAFVEGPEFGIISIDGHDIGLGSPLPLPGIRVGDGEGSGYVFRREIDGQLVFAPDAGYSGTTSFKYTVADASGDTATIVASVNVKPHDPLAPDITFTDGSYNASVVDGVDTAIIGALGLTGNFGDDADALFLQVFEGDSSIPSDRFVVAGDKLQLVAPLNHTLESTIPLRVVASNNDREVAWGEIEIEVRPASSFPGFPAEAMGSAVPLRPMLAYSAEQSHSEAIASDQFQFKSTDADEPADGSVLAFELDAETVALLAFAHQERPAAAADVADHPHATTSDAGEPAITPPSDPGDFSGL